MLKKALNLLLLLVIIKLILLITSIYSIEYMYPIAAINENKILCIHQESVDSINAVAYDPQEKQITPILSSRFNPFLLHLLPDNSGFSFIDNGIIKIKNTMKRSPRSIEIIEPLYDINYIKWVNTRSFYINAKYNQHFGVFHVDCDGHCEPIIFQSKIDFLHPQKEGSNLFLIERSYYEKQNRYRVLKLKYPPLSKMDIINLKNGENFNFLKNNSSQREYFDQKVDFACKKNNAMPILDFGVRPIAYLMMNSDREGFVLEHQPSVIKKKNETIDFCFHHIYEQPSGWQSECIFTFSIPIDFLFFESDALLYERMLPLLPKKIGDYIYYTSCTSEIDKKESNMNLNIFRYDASLNMIEQLTHATKKGEHYLCPLLVGTKMYCGKSLMEGELPTLVQL